MRTKEEIIERIKMYEEDLELYKSINYKNTEHNQSVIIGMEDRINALKWVLGVWKIDENNCYSWKSIKPCGYL